MIIVDGGGDAHTQTHTHTHIWSDELGRERKVDSIAPLLIGARNTRFGGATSRLGCSFVSYSFFVLLVATH